MAREGRESRVAAPQAPQRCCPNPNPRAHPLAPNTDPHSQSSPENGRAVQHISSPDMVVFPRSSFTTQNKHHALAWHIIHSKYGTDGGTTKLGLMNIAPHITEKRPDQGRREIRCMKGGVRVKLTTGRAAKARSRHRAARRSRGRCDGAYTASADTEVTDTHPHRRRAART